MIVADASLVIDALDGMGEARDVLGGDVVVVPHLIDAEVVHALRALVRRRRLSAGDAGVRLDAWMRLTAERMDAQPLIPRIWELRDVLSAYDATYVALAEALGCSLVTRDARIAGAPGLRCPVRVAGRP